MSERSEIKKITQLLEKLGVTYTKTTVKSNYKSSCCNAKLEYGISNSYPYEFGDSCSKCKRVLTLAESREYEERSKGETLYAEDIAKMLVNKYKIGTKNRFEIDYGDSMGSGDGIIKPTNYKEK